MSKQDISVIVVDDDPSLRDMFVVFLEDDGLNVTSASNGLEAWNILNSGQNFDVLISDVMMPQSDGIELLTKLSTLPKDKRPLIYMMSGFSRLTKEKALELGAVDLLEKPFNIDQLLSDIRDRLA